MEVVNRLLVKCVKALLSERKMPEAHWTLVLPVVQAALNSRPSPRLKGISPLQAFTQLPAEPLKTALISTTPIQVVDLEQVWTKQLEQWKQLQDGLNAFHKALSTASKKLLQQARNRTARKAQLPTFHEGDFVLTAAVTPTANKLALQWKGPKRIVRAVNDYVFEVQDLTPPLRVSTHHASRLKLYAEKDRGEIQDLQDHCGKVGF